MKYFNKYLFNLDFNTNRDDFDRRQGFSNRGGFNSGNQQMRGSRGNFQSRDGNNFLNRGGGGGGRDGNMRGGKLN